MSQAAARRGCPHDLGRTHSCQRIAAEPAAGTRVISWDLRLTGRWPRSPAGDHKARPVSAQAVERRRSGRLAVQAQTQASWGSGGICAHRSPASTKRAMLIGILKRAEGASVTEIGQRLGWLPHTVRARSPVCGTPVAGEPRQGPEGSDRVPAGAGPNWRPVTVMSNRHRDASREALSRLPLLG